MYYNVLASPSVSFPSSKHGIHVDSSPSALLLFDALIRRSAWFTEDEGTNGAACTAEGDVARLGSPRRGTNGLAEDVSPFPTGLPCPLAFASDITRSHMRYMIAYLLQIAGRDEFIFILIPQVPLTWHLPCSLLKEIPEVLQTLCEMECLPR